MNRDYSDIINLEHPRSRNHPRMSMNDRAAQFAPFAALTGYKEVINEVERITDNKKITTDYVNSIINDKLNIIKINIRNMPIINIRYFESDKIKSGGSYKKISGPVKKINEYEKYLLFENGVKIEFQNILEINSDLFNNVDI